MGKKSKNPLKKNRSKSPTPKREAKEARATTRAAAQAAQAVSPVASSPAPRSAPNSPVSSLQTKSSIQELEPAEHSRSFPAPAADKDPVPAPAPAETPVSESTEDATAEPARLVVQEPALELAKEEERSPEPAQEPELVTEEVSAESPAPDLTEDSTPDPAPLAVKEPVKQVQHPVQEAPAAEPSQEVAEEEQISPEPAPEPELSTKEVSSEIPLPDFTADSTPEPAPLAVKEPVKQIEHPAQEAPAPEPTQEVAEEEQISPEPTPEPDLSTKEEPSETPASEYSAHPIPEPGPLPAEEPVKQEEPSLQEAQVLLLPVKDLAKEEQISSEPAPELEVVAATPEEVRPRAEKELTSAIEPLPADPALQVLQEPTSPSTVPEAEKEVEFAPAPDPNKTEEEVAPFPEPKEQVQAIVPSPEEPVLPTPIQAPEVSASIPVPRTTPKIEIMSSARVTLEHLEIIHKYGSNAVNKETAVADMHNALKTSDGGLGELKSSQYAFIVNPLKEAIWFERKGQFAAGCAPDWTLCKVFMTTKMSVSALTNNLGLVDLDDLPGDNTVNSLVRIGNKLTDKDANEWFHKTLEALYDLVEMDSTGAIDCQQRDDLFQLVASFVRKGSRACFQTATPAPKLTGLSEPPQFGFSVIMQVFAKLKEVGAKNLDAVDWDSMNIKAEDGVAIWKSLSERAQLDLPISAWWKVLFLLVLEYEPHLLRMNLHLLDKSSTTSFQEFLDECIEPPELANNRFYKRMIQQVFTLQKICLLTTPPRRNMSPLTQLDKAFESGANAVYNPEVEALFLSPEEPSPTPVPDTLAEPKMVATAMAPQPPPEPPASAPAPTPALAPMVPPMPEPERVDVPPPQPVVTSFQVPVPNAAQAPAPVPPQIPTLASAGVPPTLVPPVTPVTTYTAVPVPKSAGKVPRSPRGLPRDIPLEIKTDLAPRNHSDNYSVTGSLVAELNKEEALLDLMQQAAAICDNITSEKRDLITKERRMARNLRSAEENLRAVQAVNAQLMAENSSQKEEIYQREDEINQLQVEAKHAAKELSVLDTQNSQLLEQIEELTRLIASLNADKTGLEQAVQQSREETLRVQAALEVSNKEKAQLDAQIVSEQEGKAALEQDLAKMQQEKDTVELKLKDLQGLLELANDEIDRLEEIQAEQHRNEAESRKAAMEARRREFELAEREAEESLRKADLLRKTKTAVRKTRMFS